MFFMNNLTPEFHLYRYFFHSQKLYMRLEIFPFPVISWDSRMHVYRVQSEKQQFSSFIISIVHFHKKKKKCVFAIFSYTKYD